jgi:phosphatidate cytidylyltransferase
MDGPAGVPLAADAAASPERRSASLVKRLASTLVLLPVFVWVVVLAPTWVFAALVVLVGALGQWEFGRMFGRAGAQPFTAVGLAGGLLVTASFLGREAVAPALSAVILAVFLAGLARRGGLLLAWEPVALTLLGVLYVNWLLGHALWLRALPAGAEWVLLLVWVTWIGETGAYVVGSTLGRRKLAPLVSPRKTVEGAAAQLLLSPVAALGAQGWLSPPLTAAEAVGVGLLLGVAGQMGDLVESLLKRSAGTKDTGHLIPGHGGVLDRIDGLLFNTPVLFYYVAWGRSMPS